MTKSSPPPTIRKVHTGRGGAGNTILIATTQTSSPSTTSQSQKASSLSSSILKHTPRASVSSTSSSTLTVPATAQKTASTGRGGAGNIRPMYSIITDDAVAKNVSVLDEKRVTGKETGAGRVAWSRDDGRLQLEEQEQRQRRRHVGRGGAGNRCVVEKEAETGIGGEDLGRRRLVRWGL